MSCRATALLLAVCCPITAQNTAVGAIQLHPFQRQILTTSYHAEGVCVGDFDGDGIDDIASGPFWYRGPDFARAHQVFAPRTFPLTSYADVFVQFAEDVDGDGHVDLLTVGFPGTLAQWWRNPGNGIGTWVAHRIWPTAGMESPTLVDLDGDGAGELLCVSAGQLVWLDPDPARPTADWTLHRVSPIRAFSAFTHGLGYGDVNGDGRDDVVLAIGWLEQPPSLAGDPAWTPHLHDFGQGGGQIGVFDVDGDGDHDVVSSRNGHGYGLDWYENLGAGAAFTRHAILPAGPVPGDPSQFSQLHAVAYGDVDGDGLLDLVTGKTWLAHNGADPEWWRPPVVDAFLTRRSPTGTRFAQRRIDSWSGIGRQLQVIDLDGNGKAEIVTANKTGARVFWNGR